MERVTLTINVIVKGIKSKLNKSEKLFKMVTRHTNSIELRLKNRLCTTYSLFLTDFLIL